MNHQELIEKAREWIPAVIHGDNVGAWHMIERLADALEAVFEEAHTPTDEEAAQETFEAIMGYRFKLKKADHLEKAVFYSAKTAIERERARAGVTAEEPEREYGRLIGEAPYQWLLGSSDHASATHWRTKAIPAGPWVSVEQGDET